MRLTDSQRRYRRKELGQQLEGIRAAGDRAEARIEHELSQAGASGCSFADLAVALETDEPSIEEVVSEMSSVHVHPRGRRVFRTEDLVLGERELLQSVDKMLARRPAAASIKRTALRATRSLPQPLIDALIELLIKDGRARGGSEGRILLLERLKPLPAAEQARLDKVVAVCTERGFRPPSFAELEEVVGVAGDALRGLVERASDEGLIELVGEHYYLSSVVRSAMQSIRANCLRHDEELEIPELRDELGTSRKFLIPLLEHVDARGLTVLRAGVRRLLASSDLNRELAAESGN